jgi:hypothetical protein
MAVGILANFATSFGFRKRHDACFHLLEWLPGIEFALTEQVR